MGTGLIVALTTMMAAGGLEGCAPSGLRADFDSPDPSAKMFAIERAAREGDLNAVPRIIEQLDSDDPAVRFIAIGALERLTGETYGYRHYAPRSERDEAIQRWVEAAQSDDFSPNRLDPMQQNRANSAEDRLAGGASDD